MINHNHNAICCYRDRFLLYSVLIIRLYVVAFFREYKFFKIVIHEVV